ncbi:MAG: hypothetical protein ACI4SG_08405 [Oligosphaeraceae bacterium]
MIRRILLLLALCGCLFMAASCSETPTKTGGGGHQQPYDPKTGEYR